MELQTKVYFENVLGEPIRESENILKEREKILEFTQHPTYNDSLAEIKKFIKNVEQGRYHYVGFAVSHGFESIDYQDPETGNAAMHIACRLGFPEVVEELLKYKACPDMKNKLGNYPVHEAWMFWETENPLRTKEKREDQERRTCEILLKLFSYGAFVDAQDLNLQTALHIAARLGPTRAVKIILTFQADITIRTKTGHNATQLAEEFHQTESFRLLSSWDNIRPHFTHADFHVVWHKFLQDYEAVMNSHKPAQQILAELELSNNARHMGRDSKLSGLIIDDPLLQSAFLLARAEKNSLPPKPWEPGWKRYVKSIPIKPAANSLEGKLDLLKPKVVINEKLKSKYKEPSAVEIRRNMLPERELPLTWDERYNQPKIDEEDDTNGQQDDVSEMGNSLKEGIGGSEEESKKKKDDNFEVSFVDSFFGVEKKVKKVIHYEKSEMRRRRTDFAQRVALDSKYLNYTKQPVHESAMGLPLRTHKAPLDGTEEENNPMRYILSQGIEFEDLAKYRSKNKLKDLYGIQKTPEKNSIGAYSEEISLIQMHERDKLFYKLHNIKSLLNTSTVNINADGKVSSSVPSSGMSVAGSSNSSVTSGTATKRASSPSKTPANVTVQDTLKPRRRWGEIVTNESSTKEPLALANKIEVEKQQKLDLVNDLRPRYVESGLLPDKRVVTKIDEMILEQKSQEEKNLLKKLKLSSTKDLENARNQFQSDLLNEQKFTDIKDSVSQLVENLSGNGGDMSNTEKQMQMAKILGDDSNNNHFKYSSKVEHDRQQAIKRLFLSKPKITYGEGRLTSSHNLTGKLEEPWVFVDGAHKNRVGDRTI